MGSKNLVEEIEKYLKDNMEAVANNDAWLSCEEAIELEAAKSNTLSIINLAFALGYMRGKATE